MGGTVPEGKEDALFARPEDTVIVMLTSGTTSFPKIVPISQRTIMQFCVSLLFTAEPL